MIIKINHPTSTQTAHAYYVSLRCTRITDTVSKDMCPKYVAENSQITGQKIYYQSENTCIMCKTLQGKFRGTQGY